MRIFKRTTDFWCSEESPIVPVWISFLYLPDHFMYCKEALFFIASVIDKPLWIDQATASLACPSIGRVLVEYNVTQPLLPQIRINVGDYRFWQSVIFEKISLYCASCKHLGHTIETCYVANPGLRPQRPNGNWQTRVDNKQSQVLPSDTEQPLNTLWLELSITKQIVDAVSPIVLSTENRANATKSTLIQEPIG